METRKVIVDFIERQAREKVPESRIENYHKQGVILSPDRKFGGKTGSLPSEYPDGTKDQALHVYMELKKNKDFNLILGESFLERRPVSTKHVKKMLLETLNLEQVKNEIKSLLLKFLAPQDIEVAISRIRKYGPHVRDNSKESHIWYLFIQQLVQGIDIKYATNNRHANTKDIANFIPLLLDIMFSHFPTFTYTKDSDGFYDPDTCSVIDANDDDNKTSFCKITGLPHDKSVSNDLLIQIASIVNIKTISSTITYITDTQLEIARDDYVIIRDNFGYIENDILRPSGMSVTDKPFFIEIWNQMSNPTNDLFAMVIILLTVTRGYYEPRIMLLFQQMSSEKINEVREKFSKLPPNIKALFNALIAHSQVMKCNSLPEESNR